MLNDKDKKILNRFETAKSYLDYLIKEIKEKEKIPNFVKLNESIKENLERAYDIYFENWEK